MARDYRTADAALLGPDFDPSVSGANAPDAPPPPTAPGGETPAPAPTPAAPTPAAPTPNADGGAPGGYEPPPAQPTPSFPVPPVPPPPISVGVAGGPAQTGGGAPGPATFAGVGSEAAARYRTPFFATNRIQSGGNPVPPSRFGPGAPTLGGSAPAPVIDAFGGSDPSGAPNSDEDLARLIARIASGQGGQR